MTKFWQGVGLYVGTIVGAGMFGLPFMIMRSGLLSGVLLFILTFVILATLHAWYARVVIKTGTTHRLPGLASLYLGKYSFTASVLSAFFGIYGAILIYALLAGEFLRNLFSFGSLLPWAVFFIIGIGALLFFDLKKISIINLWMTLPLIVLVVVLFVIGAVHVEASNFDLFGEASPLLPYGVFIFSFSGAVAVPEVVELLRGSPDKYIKRIAVIGTAIPAFIYILFVVATVGVTGLQTTPESFAGLSLALGNWIGVVGSLLGLLAVATSFLVLGLYLRDLFQDDFSFSLPRAWLAVVIVPIVFILLGARDFLHVMGLVGAVAIGVDSLFIIRLYKKLVVQKFSASIFLMSALLALGVVVGIVFGV